MNEGDKDGMDCERMSRAGLRWQKINSWNFYEIERKAKETICSAIRRERESERERRKDKKRRQWNRVCELANWHRRNAIDLKIFERISPCFTEKVPELLYCAWCGVMWCDTMFLSPNFYARTHTTLCDCRKISIHSIQMINPIELGRFRTRFEIFSPISSPWIGLHVKCNKLCVCVCVLRQTDRRFMSWCGHAKV